ncbi:hypothetical protein [uncultured Rikenella sp.]|uniref:hypothetical protein n=1 Tax=uncultured Rikenella sp. TaxID=368003 RepID=UPI002636AE9B|nr:hypothetical protein [uncultured Rikenella sp.]
MNQTEENPFGSYRQTVGVVGVPLFCALLAILLASVQPEEGGFPLWAWYLLGTAVVTGAAWGVGRLALKRQVARGNPHCTTRLKRRYLLFVFVCSVMGVAGVFGLGISVLGGWIRITFAILIPAMAASVVLTCAGAALLWHLLRR